jgi:tRNA acetyltransferase TAN1
MRDFNLLATTMRGLENAACSELRYLLGEIGESAPAVSRTGVSGLIAARTALNPLEVVDRFRKILHERSYEFRYTLRVIPIERVVRTDLHEIELAVTDLCSKIGEGETFRVIVEKRFTAIHSKDIIEVAATNIKNKVNLTKPNKIVLIEVVGGLTGISVIKPDHVLSVLKEKVL